MNSTLVHIGKEMISSYSHLSEKEQIDYFLDEINQAKKELRDLTKALKFLDKSMIKITWLDNLQKKDEIIIKGIIAMGKEANLQLTAFVEKQKERDRKNGIFKKELEALREAINLHYESVLEVEHIIFDLRKNDQFLDLCKLADEF